MKKTKLMLGDNIESLRKLPDNSIDSIVTDPPYGLSFMGKKWDYDVPSVEFWREVYRVLKPGGHILSFGGTRTYHRMVVNIEDAGFEIRDQVMWLYGSGFPKSLNVGKVVEKFNKTGNASWNGTGDSSNGALGYSKLQKEQGYRKEDYANRHQNDTEITNQWKGYGTALKPANEPICVARKPLSEKSVAENVLKWGTGGINIDGCRIATTDTYNYKNGPQGNSFSVGKEPDGKRTEPVEMNREGRFPANIILDETAAELLDEQSGVSKSNPRIAPKESIKDPSSYNTGVGGNSFLNDKGGASRFFYIAKVSKKERNLGLDGFEDKTSQLNSGGIGRKTSVEKRLDSNGENAPTTKNTHPTLKPINLMTYLCRLVTPQGGIVLDPFMGSGSTGIAALLEGFRFVGMEMDKDYFKIAEARIESYEQYRDLLK